MNKKMFHGWNDVFFFTFKQGLLEKHFKPVTISIVIFLFLVGLSISVIMAFSQKKNAKEDSTIEVTYVINESGLPLYIENIHEKYTNVSFEFVDCTVEDLNQKLVQQAYQGADVEECRDVILHIRRTDERYQVSLYIPEHSVITENEGRDFLENVTAAVERSKLLSSGISMEKLIIVLSGISATMLDAGEVGRSLGEELVVSLFPMLCVFVIYMMNIVYGQNIGNVVSVEKTSKLMEMMLTMVRPSSLIFGKIFATTCIAILQMACWVSSLGVGFWLGDVVAGNIIYSEYNNVLIEIFNSLKAQDGKVAFTMGNFVVAFLIICISFLFYCVLAGLISSFATKAENLADVMSYYNIILLIGLFAIYMYVLPGEGKEGFNTFLRIFPITSAYILPGDIVVGNITVWESILYVVILLVSTIILAIITGKIYKNQLFYKGTGMMDIVKKEKAEV